MNRSSQYSETLKQIEEKLNRLQEHYGITTQALLEAAEDDPRLADVDGFDLIEWHYLVRQRESLLSDTQGVFLYSVYSSSEEIDSKPLIEYEELVAA